MIGGDAGIRTADKNFYRVRAIVMRKQFFTELTFCYAMLPLHHVSKFGGITGNRTRTEACKATAFPITP